MPITSHLRRSLLLSLLSLFALTLLLSSALAQTDPAAPELLVIPAAECSTALGQFWLTASDACVGKPFGFVCNGGASPQVEPAGTVSNSLAGVGSLVEIAVVDAVQSATLLPRAESGGMVWVRVAAEDSPLRYSALLVGEVRLRDVTPDGFPAWQSIVVETVNPTERCESAPLSLFVVQSLPSQASRVVINGVSLDITGTTVIQTEADQTHFMAISGTLGLLSAGQRASLFAGQALTIPYAPGNFAAPAGSLGFPASLESWRVSNLPVLLLDFPVQLPQAGFASTRGEVNLRTAPNTDAAILLQSPAGERLTILGRNPAGDWLHVQLSSGQTGWMFAELLDANPQTVNQVYEETPAPLQRLGELGTAAQVIAPTGTTMRSAPDISFAPIGDVAFGQKLTLLNRSPYSPWVKVDANGMVGWVALITIDTRAIIDALPIDYDVPPPPEPTAIPGSFGNAFPNPNCFPNC